MNPILKLVMTMLSAFVPGYFLSPDEIERRNTINPNWLGQVGKLYFIGELALVMPKYELNFVRYMAEAFGTSLLKLVLTKNGVVTLITSAETQISATWLRIFASINPEIACGTNDHFTKEFDPNYQGEVLVHIAAIHNNQLVSQFIPSIQGLNGFTNFDTVACKGQLILTSFDDASKVLQRTIDIDAFKETGEIDGSWTTPKWAPSLENIISVRGTLDGHGNYRHRILTAGSDHGYYLATPNAKTAKRVIEGDVQAAFTPTTGAELSDEHQETVVMSDDTIQAVNTNGSADSVDLADIGNLQDVEYAELSAVLRQAFSQAPDQVVTGPQGDDAFYLKTSSKATPVVVPFRRITAQQAVSQAS